MSPIPIDAARQWHDAEFARDMPMREGADFGRFINSHVRAARAKPRAQAKATTLPGASSRAFAQT
jgi:hypothetical protein